MPITICFKSTNLFWNIIQYTVIDRHILLLLRWFNPTFGSCPKLLNPMAGCFGIRFLPANTDRIWLGFHRIPFERIPDRNTSERIRSKPVRNNSRIPSYWRRYSDRKVEENTKLDSIASGSSRPWCRISNCSKPNRSFSKFQHDWVRILLRLSSDFNRVSPRSYWVFIGICKAFFLNFLKILLRFHLPSTRISPRISSRLPLVLYQDFSWDSIGLPLGFPLVSIGLPLGFLPGFHLSSTRISPRIQFVFH